MEQENSGPTWPHGIFIPGLQPKMSHFMEKVQKWLIKHKLGDAAEQISCQIKTACSGGKHTCLHAGCKRSRKNLLSVSIPSKDTHKAFTFCQSFPGSELAFLAGGGSRACWSQASQLSIPSFPWEATMHGKASGLE